MSSGPAAAAAAAGVLRETPPQRSLARSLPLLRSPPPALLWGRWWLLSATVTQWSFSSRRQDELLLAGLHYSATIPAVKTLLQPRVLTAPPPIPRSASKSPAGVR